MSRFPSIDGAWKAYVTGFGPVVALAASLDPVRREALREAFNAWAAPFRTGLGVTIPSDYLVTAGERV